MWTKTRDKMELSDLPIEKLPGVRRLYDLVSKYYEKRLLGRVKRRDHLPNHIGIILDGNRRFAKERDIPEEKGHMFGADRLENVLEWAQEIGIKHMTVYAFSKENFNRSLEEIGELMNLFKERFEELTSDERIYENEVKVRAIGDLSSIPEDVVETVRKAEEDTKSHDNFSLNIAIGYGGRAELADAVQSICEGIEKGDLKPGDVDESLIEDNLYTASLPDPDLIIRTSGEERLSGFLLWQSAYSELYFCEANWPNFDKVNFLRAIYNYQGRERRFGE